MSQKLYEFTWDVRWRFSTPVVPCHCNFRLGKWLTAPDERLSAASKDNMAVVPDRLWEL